MRSARRFALRLAVYLATVASVLVVTATLSSEPGAARTPVARAQFAATGASWYASLVGTTTGDGSLALPWDLGTALSGAGGKVKPGDTIYIRGGTYKGLWVSKMNGTPDAPIKVRAYQREHVILDGYLKGTLREDIDDVTDTVAAPKLNVPDGTLFNIDNETIRGHAHSKGTPQAPDGITGIGAYGGVDRGWNGTVASSHAAGTPVYTESGSVLVIDGSYTWVGEIETTVSVSRFPDRTNPIAGSNPFGRPPLGVDIRGRGNKLINAIVHDGSDGIDTANAAADDFEIHGCISYFAGWKASDCSHGHNYYIHNDNPSTSFAKIVSSISLDAFDIGFQAYTGGDTLGNVQLDRFIGSMAGRYGVSQLTEVLLGFPGGVLTNSSITNSATYDPGANGFGVDFGSAGGTSNSSASGNYLTGQNAAFVFHTSPGFTGSGNTFVGPSSAPQGSGTFLDWKPTTGVVSVVMKNDYEPGRANIAVFNWAHTATVQLDFSTFLVAGDAYEVRNAWNFFGPTVATGTWSGGLVTVPVQGLSPSVPVGAVSGKGETGPEFNAFVVRRSAGEPPPFPTPTPTPIPTATPTRTPVPPTPTPTPRPTPTRTQIPPTPIPSATPTPTQTPTLTDHMRIDRLEGTVYPAGTPTPRP
jgi:hypothetical protein